MEGFCRGCLIKYDDPEELLEYTEKNRRLFIYSTGLQVKRNDIFTFQLCKDCYVNMQQACKFKKLCRLSDKKFRTYLSLKESGETQDLCTYLKNSDDNFSLRWGGSSTPANQTRDDDNESTCTSIRNFMQDMLPDTEMPDSEARIIRQVIEEEADVLDDSLDSHWLQDDVSIATDFRLDFSPFSTPRSMSNDHFNTPKHATPDQTPDDNRFNMLDIFKSPNAQSNDNNQSKRNIQNRAIDDILCDSILDNSFGDNFDNNVKTKKVYIHEENEIVKIESSLITAQVPTLADHQIDHMNGKNYYVENTVEQSGTLIEQTISFDEQAVTFCEQPPTFVEQPVTFVEQHPNIVDKDVRGTQYVDDVDRRLNEALQRNEGDAEISLRDLLGSPSEYPTPTPAGLSTPTINNILFGEKLDENSSQGSIGLILEKLPNVDKNKYNLMIDVKSDSNTLLMSPKLVSPKEKLLQKVEKEDTFYSPGNSDSESNLVNIECCVTCNKTFKDKKGLKLHSVRAHGIKLPKAKRKPVIKQMFCDYCGKEYYDRRNFYMHLKRHEKNIQPEKRCEICGIKFRTERKYQLHLATHFGQRIQVTMKEKATCDVCDMTMLKTSLKKHQLKHTRSYVGTCEECGRGFYTLTELRDHTAEHTGERRHSCEHCDSTFKRRNALIRHMRLHTGETRYVCDGCNRGYANKPTLVHHIKSGRCRDFKKTGKMRKIPRKRANVVTILQMQNEIDTKPYRCLLCHSRHKTLNMLKNHQRKQVCRKRQEMISQSNLIEIIDPARPCANVQLEVITEE
ncbi:zinc finger protein 354A-like [Plodia interpunctella]|uniref:zinc finger protein 354A-like n=1 Tax=Plodia interpunctella TaxID=58824 RepID=UPI00236800DD|nr:zinc finger protein 354A-like [Plodia interpunctella]